MSGAPDAEGLLRVQDELEIRNVLALIAHNSDAGPVDAYGALFTEGARWEMPGVPTRCGRDEIQSASVDRRAAGVTGPGSHTRHVITTVAVGVDGDVAVAESYWQFYTGTDAVPTLRSMGHYRDTFHRTPEGWRLDHRQITAG